MNEIKHDSIRPDDYVIHGRPETIKSCKKEVKPYFNYRTELVQFHDIVLKEERVVIPAQLRMNILEKLYAGHQGQEKCKRQVSVGLCRHSNRDYLITVDSHSNYLDLYQIPNQTSEAVITAMQRSLSRFGVAEEVISNNGPCFSSAEYIQFAAA